MDKAVSAADANRNLSQFLRRVRRGRSYVVTNHGKPVAVLVPTTETSIIAAGGRAALLTRLRSQRALDIGRWSRDELYKDAG